MSATMRDRVYRISGWGTTSDWVVTRRERNGCVHLSSRSLGTTITVHESKLEMVVADRNESPSLFLATADPTSHGVGSGSALSARALPTSSGESRGRPLPVARVTDPHTAHQAARVARNTLTDNQRRVLIAHAEAGPDGLSGDEMAEKMGGEAQYALLGPRRPQLERAGFLEKAGVRPNRRNNPVQVYRCTPSGFALAAQWMEADRARAI